MRLAKCFVFVFLFTLLAEESPAAGIDLTQLQKKLDQVLNDAPTAKRTTVALKVVDLDSGKVLYDRFGDRLFTPASNLKIYTAACALDTFGPDHCFPTQVTAKVDDKRVIQGNITLIAGGNAMLSSKELAGIADRVVSEWGVRRCLGKVVVDNSRYSDTRLGPGWMWDDQPYYFNMQVTPLVLDFNVAPIPGSFDKSGKQRVRAVADPKPWVESKFRELLVARGVQFNDGQIEPAAGKQRSLEFPGTNLVETVRHFNHVSENLVGEVLLHEIAIAQGVKRPTWSDGSQLVTHWLHETAGLEKGSFKLVDGSGLSRYNLISADSAIKLLAFMRGHQHYITFFDSLNAYEVETGGEKKQTLVHAKTGGMSGVSTISGYVKTLDGRQFAFSLLGNGFIGSQQPVKDLRGKVWRELVRYQQGAMD